MDPSIVANTVKLVVEDNEQVHTPQQLPQDQHEMYRNIVACLLHPSDDALLETFRPFLSDNFRLLYETFGISEVHHKEIIGDRRFSNGDLVAQLRQSVNAINMDSHPTLNHYSWDSPHKYKDWMQSTKQSLEERASKVSDPSNPEMLYIKVVSASNVRPTDRSGPMLECTSADPFISIELLNSDQPVASTKVIKENLNPVWDEAFTIKIKDPKQIIRFTLRDEGPVRNEEIGSIYLPVHLLNDSLPHDVEFEFVLPCRQDMIKWESLQNVQDLQRAYADLFLDTNEEKGKIKAFFGKVIPPFASQGKLMKGGRVRMVLHYCHRKVKETPKTFRISENAFKMAKLILQRFMAGARQRTSEKEELRIPPDYEALLREFLFRYGADELSFDIIFLEWIVEDYMERTNGVRVNADGSPKNTSFKGVDLVCNNGSARTSYYARLLQSVSIVKQTMGKYTIKQTENVKTLFKLVEQRIQHMISNYHEALLLPNKSPMKTLSHLKATLDAVRAVPITMQECRVLVKKGIDARRDRWESECYPVPHDINKTRSLCNLVIRELNAAINEFHDNFEEIFPGFGLGQFVVDHVYEHFRDQIVGFCTIPPDDVKGPLDIHSKCIEINNMFKKHENIRIGSILPLDSLFRVFKTYLTKEYEEGFPKIVENAFSLDKFDPPNGVLTSESVKDLFDLSKTAWTPMQHFDSDISQFIEFFKSFSEGCLYYFELLGKNFESTISKDDAPPVQTIQPTSSFGALLGFGGKVLRGASAPVRFVASTAASGVKMIIKSPNADTPDREVICEFPDRKMCITINNARAVLSEWDAYSEEIAEYGAKSPFKSDFCQIMQKEKEDYRDKLKAAIDELRDKFLKKLDVALRLCFGSFFEAPLSSNLTAEERINPFLQKLQRIELFEENTAEFNDVLLGGIWKNILKMLEECLLSSAEAVFKVKITQEARLLSEALEILMGVFHLGGKRLPDEFIEKASKKVCTLIDLYRMGPQELMDFYYELEHDSKQRVKQPEVLVIFEKTQKRNVYEKFKAQITGQQQVQESIRSIIGVKESEIMIANYDCQVEKLHGKIYFFTFSLAFATKDLQYHFRLEYGSIKSYTKGRSSSGEKRSIFLDAVTDEGTVKKEIGNFPDLKTFDEAHDCLDDQMQILSGTRQRSESRSQYEERISYSLNLFNLKLDRGDSKKTRDFFKVAYNSRFMTECACNLDNMNMALFLYESKVCFYGEKLTRTNKIMIPKEDVTFVTGSYGSKAISVIISSKTLEGPKEYTISASFDTDILYMLLQFWKPEAKDQEGHSFSSEDAKESSKAARELSLAPDEKVIISCPAQESREHGIVHLSTNYLVWKPNSKKPSFFKILLISHARLNGTTLEIATVDESYISFINLKNAAVLHKLLLRRMSILKQIQDGVESIGVNADGAHENESIEYVDNIKYRRLFDIYDDDTLRHKERCWVMPNSGTLWVGTKRVCFTPDFGLLSKNIIIPLDKMVGIRKEVSAQLVDSLVIKTQDEEYRFSKIEDKDQLFEMILSTAPKDISNYQTDDPNTSQRLQSWFSLDQDDLYLEYFSCISIENSHSGGIYLTKKHLCFKSIVNIQASYIKIPIEQMSTIEQVWLLKFMNPFQRRLSISI
eukprot:TRINITY_DN1831_c0_g2_i15.p1 TRINITY_DN1831_c0_g2~~TRINITY_DN1831_c0_g2_i15.p1  ORF type:complete len:1622 (-),score=309.83 TRINITY_DN1831_c0_g2_i15:84-4949(-)